MDRRIDQLLRGCAANPGVIGLAGGLPAAALFPQAALAASTARVLAREGERVLQYTWPDGHEGLRTWIARRLARRGFAIDASEVILTNGAQEALSLVGSALLAQGDQVSIDPHSYPGAIEAFRSMGAELVAERAPARMAYTMPAIANPTGLRTCAADLEAWCAWCNDSDGAERYLIEDDAYAELGFGESVAPTPLAAGPRSRVFHIGTFSKTLCPGLRVGWIVPPAAWREALLERKRLRDLQGHMLAQSALADFLAFDDFDARIARARRVYARRADALLTALRRRLPQAEAIEPEGGFSLWVALPAHGDDAALLARAIAEGVSFDPGSLFDTQTGSRDDPVLRLRLSFSAESVARFDEGVARLARAVRSRPS